MSSLDPAAEAELEQTFAADAPERLERLARDLERFTADPAGYRDAIHARAHALQGAAAAVGRRDLADLCRSIEELLEEKEPDEEEIAAAARLLRREQQQLSPPKPVRGLSLVPRRFMSQLALLLTLALTPALAVAVYYALTDRLVGLVLVVALLGLAGFAIVYVGAKRLLGRSLGTLVATARRLEAGDLGARTGLTSRGGELGELATVIDAMAESLERQTRERERAILALGRLTGELEQRVQERTAELERARDDADRASEAKTAFVAGLSHELRTPLNAMRGFSQLLLAEELPPDQAEAAAHVAAASGHMTRLVDELLDTARIEAGQFRVDLAPVPVGAVVVDVLGLARPLADEHEVALSAQQLEAELGAFADRGRLRQALLNLVTNAIAYNDRGGEVTLSAYVVDADRVRIDVVDTGPGISAADQERLFVPYDRPGRGVESGRLGLGLALSKRLVEAMGGTIEVESEPGVGTRFTVELARAEIERGVSDASAPTMPGPRSGRRRRVLYVEDNLTSSKLVELLLRGPGVEFISKETAAEGLAAARTEAPDLILLDLELPDGSGEDVLRELRREQGLRAVPIVMLSAQASRETMRRLLEAGADDYLTKPIEIDRAAEVIERFLRRPGD